MKGEVTFLIQRELMSCRNLCPAELRAGLEMAHQQEQWEILTVSSPPRSFAPQASPSLLSSRARFSQKTLSL